MAYDATDFIVTDLPAAPSVRHPERIRALRDAILRAPQDFSMRSPSPHRCGAPVCFLGWARAIFFDGRHVSRVEASDYLGLTERQGMDLFMMNASLGAIRQARSVGVDPFKIDADQGARLLDHYVTTGEVDWSVA